MAATGKGETATVSIFCAGTPSPLSKVGKEQRPNPPSKPWCATPKRLASTSCSRWRTLDRRAGREALEAGLEKVVLTSLLTCFPGRYRVYGSAGSV